MKIKSNYLTWDMSKKAQEEKRFYKTGKITFLSV